MRKSLGGRFTLFAKSRVVDADGGVKVVELYSSSGAENKSQLLIYPLMGIAMQQSGANAGSGKNKSKCCFAVQVQSAGLCPTFYE